MKQITQYIQEKLKINSKSKVHTYNYHPKDKDELSRLLKKLIKERGKNADLNDIDTSKIDNMNGLFGTIDFWRLDIHNIDISQWDVSNVESMECMFLGNHNLDCDLSSWDVSNVKNMTCMFSSCLKFTGKGLDKWKINPKAKLGSMFYNTYSLKDKPDWYKNKKE